jgi:hypothetical protein
MASRNSLLATATIVNQIRPNPRLDYITSDACRFSQQRSSFPAERALQDSALVERAIALAFDRLGQVAR